MKKTAGKTILLLAAVLVTLICAATAYADEAYVYGKVYINDSINDNETQMPVVGADVAVTCDATNEITEVITDSEGRYETPIEFQCPRNSTVTVTATTDDGRTGTETGTLADKEYGDEGQVVYIGMAMVDVPILAPEIISALAAIAALAPGLAYMKAKKKN